MKKGFTLVELIAVIVILGSTIILVASKVEKNVEKASNLESSAIVDMIENSAVIYVDENTLTNLENYNVDTITLQTLVSSGLIKESYLNGVNLNNLVVVARINGMLKVKYIASVSPINVIFLNGFDEVIVKQNETYTDAKANVAVINDGVYEISGTSVDTGSTGSYEIYYSYPNANTVTRKVNVVSN